MRLHVVVRGRVQGVGFRWFVRETACALDIPGWVRNRADGGVEVVAEGSDTLIQSLRSALLVGPRGATVAELEEMPPSSEELSRPFAIKR